MDSAGESEDLHGGAYSINEITGHHLGHSEDDSGDDDRHHGVLREQDRFLPIANVARLMKKAIPKSGKIAKEARECVQECVSEFVSFITSEASDRCHQEKRKTINGEDILFAMQGLGFDNYVDPLKLYLQKYRDLNRGEKPDEVFATTSMANIAAAGSSTTVTAVSATGTLILKTEHPDGPSSAVVTQSLDGIPEAAAAAENSSDAILS